MIGKLVSPPGEERTVSPMLYITKYSLAAVRVTVMFAMTVAFVFGIAPSSLVHVLVSPSAAATTP